VYEALPPGSYVFIHHLLALEDPEAATLQEEMRAGRGRAQFRTMKEVRVLFGGLELVEPGLVPVPAWRPEPSAASASAGHRVLEMACAGVARKRLVNNVD
jgi:S-adenosyl methyltransferase